MISSIKIGKNVGIEIGVHWSWVFIFLLITYSFAEGLLSTDVYEGWSAGQRWSIAIIVAVVFFISILLHELSHSIVAKARGMEVKGITLFVFGGVSNLGREAESAGEEFQIAIVGPATSLLIGALFAVLWFALRPVSAEFAGIAAYLAFINAVIAAFNMLPGFPLDGGRVFRSIVWARNRNLLRATRTAARVGEGVAYLLMAGGAIQFFFNPIGGVWMFLIGMFLRGASASSYEQMVLETALHDLSAGDVARTDYVTISPEMTVDHLVSELMLTGRGRAYPIMAGQELLGLITLTDVQRLDREKWPETSVYRAMTPVDKLHTASVKDPAVQIVQTMSQHDVNQIPVLDGRLLVGMVSRGDILRLIQVRREVAIET